MNLFVEGVWYVFSVLLYVVIDSETYSPRRWWRWRRHGWSRKYNDLMRGKGARDVNSVRNKVTKSISPRKIEAQVCSPRTFDNRGLNEVVRGKLSFSSGNSIIVDHPWLQDELYEFDYLHDREYQGNMVIHRTCMFGISEMEVAAKSQSDSLGLAKLLTIALHYNRL